jgi:hypothetical protein
VEPWCADCSKRTALTELPLAAMVPYEHIYALSTRTARPNGRLISSRVVGAPAADAAGARARGGDLGEDEGGARARSRLAASRLWRDPPQLCPELGDLRGHGAQSERFSPPLTGKCACTWCLRIFANGSPAAPRHPLMSPSGRVIGGWVRARLSWCTTRRNTASSTGSCFGEQRSALRQLMDMLEAGPAVKVVVFDSAGDVAQVCQSQAAPAGWHS